jgi:hypothetical protein
VTAQQEIVEATIMRRRRFVQLGLNGCLVMPLAASASDDRPDPLAVLRDLVGEPRRAEAIGRSCLDAGLVSPATARAFVAEISRDAGDRRSVEGRFHRHRQDDFTAGRLRSLRGWQLAESEVRAFAALALA